MSRNKKLKRILEQMKEIYYKNIKSEDEYIDWMGYKIDKKNYPTYHHIVKASVIRSNSDYYVDNFSNGAYLGTQSHSVLHFIEQLDKNIYDDWNEIFRKINKSRCYPSQEILNEIILLQDRSMGIIDNYNFKLTKVKKKKK